MEIIAGGRQSGKTTKLLEKAIEWMGENEDGIVWFLGFNERWTQDIKQRCEEAGLVGFRFLSPGMMPHNLRGISGMLAVDNFDMMTINQQEDIVWINRMCAGRLDVVVTWNAKMYD